MIGKRPNRRVPPESAVASAPAPPSPSRLTTVARVLTGLMAMVSGMPDAVTSASEHRNLARAKPEWGRERIQPRDLRTSGWLAGMSKRPSRRLLQQMYSPITMEIRTNSPAAPAMQWGETENKVWVPLLTQGCISSQLLTDDGIQGSARHAAGRRS